MYISVFVLERVCVFLTLQHFPPWRSREEPSHMNIGFYYLIIAHRLLTDLNLAFTSQRAVL